MPTYQYKCVSCSRCQEYHEDIDDEALIHICDYCMQRQYRETQVTRFRKTEPKISPTDNWGKPVYTNCQDEYPTD